MGAADDLAPYLQHIRALPFVRSVRLNRGRNTPSKRTGDYRLTIRTDQSSHDFQVELKKSHVSPAIVHRLIDYTRGPKKWLLLAPAVSKPLGDTLEESGLNFVDRAGNCYFDLAGKHVARVQGRRAQASVSAEKALRAPAYRALFALIAEPKLAASSVRALAEAAGVSRQAALDMRHRLVGLDILFAGGSSFAWTPRGGAKALDLFISGYATTLRPHLLHGRYRTRAENPDQVEHDIEIGLRPWDGALWGGGVAAMRMTGYYRGERTVLHVADKRIDLLKRINAVADSQGPLHLVSFPGPLGRSGTTPEIAHPLLVYAELMIEGGERAHEAAQQIQERWLPFERFA
jgi:hypothetical protein